MSSSLHKSKNYRVLIVAAEVAPFVSVGGLSQVMYFLPRALLKLGVDVRIFMPKFGTIKETDWGLKMHTQGLRVPTGEKKGTTELICNVKELTGTRFNPTVYFLENMEYYEKRANVYEYTDDHVRFALLSRGALEFLRKINWVPHLIHCNDWHTGYLANYLRTAYAEDSHLRRRAVLFSIHNLHLQGNFDFRYASPLDSDDGKGALEPLFSERLQRQNPMKRGIIYSDIVNTVSETYSHEIMTKGLGEGLDDLLKELRTKVFGVLNGLDYDEFNPLTDKIIKVNYGVNSLEERIKNKVDLQKEFNLPSRENVPILAIEGRLNEQKGLDLLVELMPRLLAEYDIQFIILGGGENRYRDSFTKLEKEFPQKVGTHLMPNFTLPRKIFAGADILLLPSKFEPGGIVAIEAMRYGAVAVVRATGGLADSVKDFDPLTNTGSGFTFTKFDPWSLFAAIVRALEIYKQPRVWRGIQRRAMRGDFSWEKSAEKYLDLYERAIEFRRDTLSPKPHQAYRQLLSLM